MSIDLPQRTRGTTGNRRPRADWTEKSGYEDKSTCAALSIGCHTGFSFFLTVTDFGKGSLGRFGGRGEQDNPDTFSRRVDEGRGGNCSGEHLSGQRPRDGVQ